MLRAECGSRRLHHIGIALHPPYRRCPTLGCRQAQNQQITNVSVGGVSVKHRISRVKMFWSVVRVSSTESRELDILPTAKAGGFLLRDGNVLPRERRISVCYSSTAPFSYSKAHSTFRIVGRNIPPTRESLGAVLCVATTGATDRVIALHFSCVFNVG